jgi:hypothetical protein
VTKKPLNVTVPLPVMFTVTTDVLLSGGTVPEGIPKDRSPGETETVCACSVGTLTQSSAVSSKTGVSWRRKFPSDFICPPSGEPGNTKSRHEKPFLRNKVAELGTGPKPEPD